MAAGASLALGIAILYLHPADQYFFGDSISVLISRSLTWRGAFLDLFRLGGHHWYRPLTNGIVQFILWPMFGMNFAAYHYLAMAMHWAVCVGLYLGLRNLLDDPFAAWAGAAKPSSGAIRAAAPAVSASRRNRTGIVESPLRAAGREMARTDRSRHA